MKQKEYIVSSKFVHCELAGLKEKLEICKIHERGEGDKCDAQSIAD